MSRIDGETTLKDDQDGKTTTKNEDIVETGRTDNDDMATTKEEETAETGRTDNDDMATTKPGDDEASSVKPGTKDIESSSKSGKPTSGSLRNIFSFRIFLAILIAGSLLDFVTPKENL